MNILLLSNSAYNHFHFFNAFCKLLEKDNNDIFVAVDSKFSRDQNSLDQLGFPIYEFSEFFKSHEIDYEILKKYSHYNLNSALLADFERAQVYGLWGNYVGIEYFEKLKSALLSYFEMIFEEQQISAVLYEAISNAFAHFAYFVAQEKGVKYYGLSGSRLPRRFTLTSDPFGDETMENVFDDIHSGKRVISPEILDWVQNYIAQIETMVPDYMKYNNLEEITLFKRYFKTKYLSKIYRLLKYLPDNRLEAFQIANPPLTHFKLFWRNLKRRIHTITLKNQYQPSVDGEDFLLYPLHFHPESSTSILAGAYLNEYEVIRNIAFNLPQGVKLYVKDHISAWGYPSREFYRNIKQLPNVRLLAPTEATKQLIKRSKGIITLTSTVGYEALLLHKPVFLYGRVFYEFHKGVHRIENTAKIYDMIQYHLQNPTEWDAQYNLDFVCAYHETTYPGLLNLLMTGEDASELAKMLYSEIYAYLQNGSKGSSS